MAGGRLAAQTPVVTPGGTRTVEHALGTTEVPANPQRIATLSVVVASHLVSVGMAPVAANRSVTKNWLEPYRDLLPEGVDIDGIEAIGETEEPDLERLVVIGPDLILIETYQEDIYPLLSEIAPTMAIERPSNAAWKSAFDQTVDAVGRRQEAEAVRQRYRDEVVVAPEAASSTRVAFIRAVADGGTFLIDGTGGFAGSVAAEAGYPVDDGPEDESPDEFGYVTVSQERLGQITADLIVVPDPRENAVSFGVEVFQDNPFWDQLPAVQAGQVLALPQSIYNGGTYLAAELLLRALREALT